MRSDIADEVAAHQKSPITNQHSSISDAPVGWLLDAGDTETSGERVDVLGTTDVIDMDVVRC